MSGANARDHRERDVPAALTLGVDEAGRGPAIGEMVVAVVGLTPTQAAELATLGVADSKSFGASAAAKRKRAGLAAQIRAVASYCGLRVAAVEVIDQRVARGELNQLERELAGALLTEALGATPEGTPTQIYADGAKVFGPLGASFANVYAVDHGESIHVAVAAASIIAKAHRDALFAQICARYAGDFGEIGGGGYLNPPTRAFLTAYAQRHGALLPEARRSWPYPFLAAFVADLPLR